MADAAAPALTERSTKLHLQLLGPLEAWSGGRKKSLPRAKKAQAVLLILALSGETGMSRKGLAGLLWSQNTKPQALARLRGALHHLRHDLRSAQIDERVVDASDERIRFNSELFDFETSFHSAVQDVATRQMSENEIGSPLDGLDPALDTWLGVTRQRFRRTVQTQPSESSRSVRSRGAAVIGIGILKSDTTEDPMQLLGLADEISTALARVRGVIVIANASMSGALAAGRSLQTDFGIEYLLDGTLYRHLEGLRVTIRLVDVAQGMLVWTWSKTLSHADITDCAPEIAALVVAGLEPEILLIQEKGRRERGELDHSAYSLLLKAIPSIYLLEQRTFMQAGRLLKEAIALEPRFASLHSWFALWTVFLVGQGWAADSRGSIARAGEAAEHAITLDSNDARGLAIAGHVRAFLHRRLTEAFPLYERALAVNPSLPLAWHLSGVGHAYGGDLNEARHRLDRCHRLAPHDPHSFFADGARTILELLSRNHVTAVEVGRRVVQLHPRFSAGYKPYLSALGHLGKLDEAHFIHNKLLVLEPDFNIESFEASSPFHVQEHVDHYVAGLVLAGLSKGSS